MQSSIHSETRRVGESAHPPKRSTFFCSQSGTGSLQMPLLQMTLVVEDTILELRGKIQTAAVDDNIGFEVPERDILAGFDLVRLQLLNDLNAFFHTCL